MQLKFIFNTSFFLFLLSFNSYSQWEHLNCSLTGRSVFHLTIDQQTLYAGTDDGVFKSITNASSWEDISDNLPENFHVNQGGLIAFNDTVFACSDTNLYRKIKSSDWEKIKSPGRIIAFAVYKSFIFASTYLTGVFISPDHGKTWSKTKLSSLDVIAFAVTKGEILTGSNFGPLHYSSDGLSWKIENNPGVSSTMKSNATALYSDAGQIYLSSNGYVYRRDTTKIWKQLNLVPLPGSISTIAKQGGILYSLINNEYAIWKSLDSGKTWTSTTPISKYTPILTTMVYNNGRIIVGHIIRGVAFSENQGETWDNGNTGIPGSATSFFKAGPILSFLSLAEEGDYIFSKNKGETCLESMTFFPYGHIEILKESAGNIYVVTKKGFYVSADTGATWKNRSEGINFSDSTTAIDLLLDQNKIILNRNNKDLYYSSNEGVSWTNIDNGIDPNRNVTFIDEYSERIIAVTYGMPFYPEPFSLFPNGHLYPHNSGEPGKWKVNFYINNINSPASWETAQVGLPDSMFYMDLQKNDIGLFAYIESSKAKTGMVTDSLGNKSLQTYHGFERSLYQFIATEKKWTKLPFPNLPDTVWLSFNTTKNNLFVFTYPNSTAYKREIYRSLNGGITWKALSEDLSFTPNDFYGVLEANNYIFISDQTQGLYRSNINEFSWEHLTNGIDPSDVSLGNILNSDKGLFIGSNYSIYSSQNNGDSWSKIASLPNNLHNTAYNVLDNVVYVWTSKNGGWRLDLEKVLAIDKLDANIFSVSVFPNPADEHVSIELSEKFSNSIISITLKDIIGQEIYKKEFKVERKNLVIPLPSISEGLYFFSVESDVGKWIEKIIIKR